MKCQIRGLIEIREHRGLRGVGAREAWMMDAMEVLLRAELQRLEKEKSHEGSELVDH